MGHKTRGNYPIGICLPTCQNKIHQHDKVRMCAECDKMFHPKKDNPHQEYCSESCWERSNDIK